VFGYSNLKFEVIAKNCLK